MRILRSVFTSLFLLSLLLGASAFGQGIPAATCPLHAGQTLTITASGTTEIVAVPSQTSVPIFINGVSTVNPAKPKVVICSVQIQVNQAAGAADYGLVQGTGTACATGQTNLTPQWQGTASVKETKDFLYGASAPLVAGSGNAVCLKLSAAPTGARVLVTYQVVIS